MRYVTAMFARISLIKRTENFVEDQEFQNVIIRKFSARSRELHSLERRGANHCFFCARGLRRYTKNPSGAFARRFEGGNAFRARSNFGSAYPSQVALEIIIVCSGAGVGPASGAGRGRAIFIARNPLRADNFTHLRDWLAERGDLNHRDPSIRGRHQPRRICGSGH